MWLVDPMDGSPARTRSRCDASISRHVTLNAEDVDTCPSDEKRYLRGGRASLSCLFLGFLKVGAGNGPNCVTSFAL